MMTWNNYIVNYGGYHFLDNYDDLVLPVPLFFGGGSTSFGFRPRCQAREPDRWARNLRNLSGLRRHDVMEKKEAMKMGIIWEL